MSPPGIASAPGCMAVSPVSHSASTESIHEIGSLSFPLTSQFGELPGDFLLDLPTGLGDGATINFLTSSFLDQSSGLAASDNLQWNTSFGSITHMDGFDAGAAGSSDPQFLPNWQLLPLHLPATIMLDQVLLKTTESGRQWIRHSGGKQHSELSQPSFPSISSLLNPHPDDDTENPIASAVSAQAWRTTVTSFSARIAFYYVVASILRWFVAPSEETYNLLPEYIKPTKLQLTVPHAAWIDIFAWPEGRDAIIKTWNTRNSMSFVNCQAKLLAYIGHMLMRTRSWLPRTASSSFSIRYLSVIFGIFVFVFCSLVTRD